MNTTGRIALVTGGASGIGKAVAQALTRDGNRVVIADLNVEQGKNSADEIEALFIHADLSTRQGCQSAIEEVKRTVGPVSILINNAGFQHIDSIEDFPEDVWDRLHSLMLTAPFLLMKYCWADMRAAGFGRIVNISSIHGLVASPFKSAYIAAKHGIIGLTKAGAVEGGEQGVTVNAVCPAFTMTPLVEGQVADLARSMDIPEDQVLERVMLEPALIKRALEPSEVADVVAYLCSDRARGITGASWTVDLGWTAR